LPNTKRNGKFESKGRYYGRYLQAAWGVYVTVDDVDATAAKAEELGGKILVPPTDIPNVGRFCVLQDPQGSVISAITYAMDD
jgi:predicted enzyme related to lactoylglutathione lyase